MLVELQNKRILVVDDRPAIHDDFRKILGGISHSDAEFNRIEQEIFGAGPRKVEPVKFEIESAFQGEEAFSMLKSALDEQRPYALAFMDVRMPPGWDGIETTEKLWEIDPELQVVICTAYSDYSWQDMTSRLGSSDRFLILKKPFIDIEVLQLAHSLASKWELRRQNQLYMQNLEAQVEERTKELRKALENVRTLSGLLPICCSCKRIRDDKGYWSQVEVYVAEHTHAAFSHGLCPDCLQRFLADVK